MARTTLSYLQDEEDPLNQYLSGGGPDVSEAPAYDQTPPEPDHSLDESLLQPSAAVAPSAPDPQPQLPPPSAPAQNDQIAAIMNAHRDPELDAAYRNAQMDALAHGGFDDNKYGVGEAVRDNGAALIASILDIGFNKGRGLGGIVGATANEVGRQAAQRDLQRKEARDFALAARKQAGGDPVMQQIALMNAMTHQQTAATGAQRVGEQINWHGQQANADSQLNQTRPIVAGRIAAASTDARQDTEHDNAPRTAADAAAQAGAVTDAQLHTQLGYAPQQAAAGALKAGAEAQARLPAETQLKQTATPTEQRAAADEQLRQTPIPGITVDDAQAYGAATMADRKGLEKYAQGVQTSVDALSKMIELRQQLGPVWNTLDDRQKSIMQKTLSDLQKQAIGGATVVGNSGVLNGAEFGRYAADIPDGSFAATDLTDQLLGAATQTNRDTQLEKMIAARDAFTNAATAGLKSAGAHWGAPQPVAAPQAVQAPPAPTQSTAMPGYSTDYSDPRTSLGAPQPAPPNPATAPPVGGQNIHHVRKPNGQVIETRLPPQALSALPRGWELVD